jgi:shikimate kinase
MNFPSQTVFLCGMMGSGKTSVGRNLADKMDVPFYDIDHLIEQKAGKSIPDLFETDGEEFFRNLEKQALIEASRDLYGVVALGGGSLQNQHLTDHIKLSGWLIYLQTSEADIEKRLQHQTGRPLLENVTNLSEKISSLMKQRIPYYSQAHLTVDTSGLTAGEVSEIIINKLKFYEQRND